MVDLGQQDLQSLESAEWQSSAKPLLSCPCSLERTEIEHHCIR